MRPEATEAEVVRAGKTFGWVIAIVAMSIAPWLDQFGRIFVYLQKMNAMYFIPIFAVVLVGLLTGRVPPLAAKVGLVGGVGAIAAGYFLEPFKSVADSMTTYYFVGTVFAWSVVIMLVIGAIRPMETEWVQEDVKAVDMTPWRHAKLAGFALIIAVLTIYASFADFSVLR